MNLVTRRNVLRCDAVFSLKGVLNLEDLRAVTSWRGFDLKWAQAWSQKWARFVALIYVNKVCSVLVSGLTMQS